MLMFRLKSKYGFRRLSNEFSIYKQMQFSPEKTNFHLVSFIVLILISSLSCRYGKWILFTHDLLFMVITMTSYCTKIRDSLSDKIAIFRERVVCRFKQGKRFLKELLNQMVKIETEFLKLNNISSTSSQIIFFIICEKILVSGHNVTALYSLMFYNVLTYCILYMCKLLSDNHWSPYINVANHSDIKHVAMSATKIVLEVTKFITFFITIVFMLFVLCLEQKIHHYKPTKLFTLLTAMYYLATENMFAEYFPPLLTYFRISYLENLETLWAPVLLNIISQSLSIFLVGVLLIQEAYCNAIIVLYLNVYLKYRKLITESLKILNEEKKAMSQFRYATRLELEQFEDVCAICLTDMKFARVTPCYHIFHADCLRKCLLSCDKCPVCKRKLLFS